MHIYRINETLGVWRKGKPGEYPAQLFTLKEGDLFFTLLLYARALNHCPTLPAVLPENGPGYKEDVNEERQKLIKHARRLERMIADAINEDACFYGFLDDNLLVYPPPQRSFHDMLKTFLLESAGNVWLTYGHYISRKANAYQPLELPSVAIGPSIIHFHDGTILIENVWQVSHEGLSRFDLLWNGDLWHRDSRNPWACSAAYTKDYRGSFYLLVDGALEKWWLDDESYPPYWVDQAAVLSAVAGHTSLSSSELVILIFSVFGNSSLYSTYKNDRSRRISPILIVDMLSRIPDDEREAANELIRSSRKFQKRSEYRWAGINNKEAAPGGAIFFPYPRDLITHKELFEMWMIARSQLGRSILPLKEVNAERYFDFVSNFSN